MTDKSHLLSFGYAPGNYWFVCHDCGNKFAVGDKRATRCEACAETLYSQVSSVEAVADKHRAMTTVPEEAVKAADIIQVITDLRLAILQDDDEGLAEHAEPMIKAKELISRLSASPHLPGVGVKKLEWRQEENGDYIAESVIGWYHIGLPHRMWNLTKPNGEVPSFWMLEDAKDAAQADYEARVKSAIVGGGE
ncbi:putative nucleic acid-binding Zn-ribbon protein [Ochrobactrum sp. RH1CCR137]|nr:MULTISPECIES: hypothetical protein [unclassified Ochrobactrum]MBA8846220.1 putative nucleic acid-binding Zn-ribbon protein [Ochrobactrum sp. RH1CCR137]MBA8858039.1 putative nucleic acid-binding Zn-ribbon protein [Ochrobactrum sp. RH1CCR134]